MKTFPAAHYTFKFSFRSDLAHLMGTDRISSLSTVRFHTSHGDLQNTFLSFSIFYDHTYFLGTNWSLESFCAMTAKQGYRINICAFKGGSTSETLTCCMAMIKLSKKH